MCRCHWIISDKKKLLLTWLFPQPASCNYRSGHKDIEQLSHNRTNFCYHIRQGSSTFSILFCKIKAFKTTAALIFSHSTVGESSCRLNRLQIASLDYVVRCVSYKEESAMMCKICRHIHQNYNSRCVDQSVKWYKGAWVTLYNENTLLSISNL